MGNIAEAHRTIINHWLTEYCESGEANEDSYLGKRTSTRYFEWSEPLEIRHKGRTLIARGSSLSTEGVGFVCKQRFDKRDEADIRRCGDEDDATSWVPIVIRHATQTIGGFKVGARFKHTSAD